jgi:hypothetical protein
MGVIRLEIEVMERTPADEGFHVIVGVVFAPGTGEPMDIMFEGDPDAFVAS